MYDFHSCKILKIGLQRKQENYYYKGHDYYEGQPVASGWERMEPPSRMRSRYRTSGILAGFCVLNWAAWMCLIYFMFFSPCSVHNKRRTPFGIQRYF